MALSGLGGDELLVGCPSSVDGLHRRCRFGPLDAAVAFVFKAAGPAGDNWSRA